jgi:hypothetical protein
MSTVTAALTIAARRGHRLAADVEADAERVGRRTSGHQQLFDLMRFGAELRSQAELAVIGRHADAHTQIEVLRAAGSANDLVELFQRVEREGAHAVIEIGFRDRLLGLDRVHEAQGRAGQSLSDQPHFGDRRDVVMRDPAVPQDLQQVRRGIRLDRIDGPARKLLHEESGGPPGGVRTNKRDRLNRPLHRDVDNVAVAVREPS